LLAWDHYRGTLGGPWDVWRVDRVNQIPWQAVQIPHCPNARDAVDPDEPYFEGPSWYRMKFRLANPFRNGRTTLHFEGAGQKTEVFIYLESIGRHVGGYDEFEIDITEAAAKTLEIPGSDGEIPLAVLCDNSRDLQMLPSALNDFCRYGGLYRPVNLVYAPAISIERVHIDAAVKSQSSGSVAVKARLYNPKSLKDPIELLIRVIDPTNREIHATSLQLVPWEGERVIASCDVDRPEFWSPTNPRLYRCEIAATSAHGAMSASERFGFRYFEFQDHGPFELNGKRLLLKGTHRHEDHAGTGAAVSDDLVFKELKLIKNLGANFIRLGHYQQSRRVLELCDELGLLVWEEIPWSRGGLGGEGYKQQARDMLHAMIDQHYNHPSVIIWGLGNENDWPGDFPEFDKSNIRAFMKELNDQAHSLDPVRKTATRRCDFCKDIVDVYSPSVWAGWYHGRYTEYSTMTLQEMQKVNHYVHVEWGGDCHARRHSEDPDRMLAKIAVEQITDAHALNDLLAGGPQIANQDRDWSESYVCNLFDWHLKEQEKMSSLAGTAQWIFKDFATPLRPDNPVPRVNQKGLLERDLTPKEGYYVFQSYWAQEPMIHIYGHSWPVRWGTLGEKKLIKVYSNCDSAELFVNASSCGVRKRNSQDFPAAGLHWLVALKPGENYVRVLGHKNAISLGDEIRFQYQTEPWQMPVRFELKEIARSDHTVTVEARLLDPKNSVCLDARNRVRFGITGDGTLLDNLGTSRGARSVELYNGRAEISLLRNDGKSMVSVSSKGLPTAFLPVG
jgi:beta-galactosidase